MKHFKQILTILCLLVAGWTSTVNGQTVQSMGTTQDDQAIYNLYYSYYNNGYGGRWMESYYATIQKVTPIIGFATIPKTVTHGNHTYSVLGFGAPSTVYSEVQNVGSLTFKGDVTMWNAPVNFTAGMTGFTTLTFEGQSYPFDGDYSQYFENNVGWVDVYLADKTESQIVELKKKAPWNQFHSVNYKPVKQTLTMNKTFSTVDPEAHVALYSLGDYETFADADYDLDRLTLLEMSDVWQFEVNKFQRYLAVAHYNNNKVTPRLFCDGLEYTMTPHYNIAYCQFTVRGDMVLDVSFPSIATWEGVLKNQTYGMVFVTELGDKTSFADNGMQNVIPYMYSTTNGQVTNGLFAGCNYSTVYVDNDPSKTPHLKRNGVEVTLKHIVRGIVQYAYYDEINVQENITYEWYSTPVETVESNPIVKVIRTGGGDVSLTGMWDWDSQDETWYNTTEVNCTAATTDLVIPLPTMSPEGDGEYWGFELNVRPRSGETVRSFMIGINGYDSDSGQASLTMEEATMTKNADGSYTFIVDCRDYMSWSIANYVLSVDMGPESVDRATLDFVRKGGKSRVQFYREDCEIDGWFDINEGSTTHNLKLYTLAEAEVCGQSMNIMQELIISPIAGETIHVYCDGEDISSDFSVDDSNNRIYELERADHTYTILIDQPQYIAFADPAVKAICVENWDTNEDGELSYEEAAAVTDIGVVFKGNTEITSFDEFQYFTGVTKIGKEAFYGDTELTSIVLPQSVVNIHGGWAFYGCSSLEHVVLPDNIGFVDTATFGQTNISSITFPGNAGSLSLGYGVITHAPLKSLFIPANVKTIYEYVVYNCPNLASISVDEGNTIYDSREGCNAIIKTSDNTLIAGCKNTVIPESVTALGNSAFFKTDGLTRLELPAGITSIGNKGIRDCSSLTTIVAHMPEPFEINTSASSNDYNISDLPATCKLIVPYGKRQAYIDAGWTESIFKGGVVEDKSQFDVNRDSFVSIADVTTLVNVILGKPIQ
jgi:hypothetical protein